MLDRNLRLLFALLLGGAGGALFSWLGLPLPFMLGSMCACMAAALLRFPAVAPQGIRPPMSAVIGAMLGTSFTPEILGDLTDWLLPMGMLTIFVAVTALTCVTYFRVIFKYDLRTAYFCGMPGGLVDMVALADEYGADTRRVALIHSIRILLIVLLVPTSIQLLTGTDLSGQLPNRTTIMDLAPEAYGWFVFTIIFGIAMGQLLRLPAKYVFGPMLVSAAIHLTGVSDYQLPFELIIMAQVVIGATIGSRFIGTTAVEFLRILPAAVGSVFLLLTLTFLFAWLVARMGAQPVIPLVLSYSPGGFAEMGLIAIALGIDTAFVATHHLARIVLVGFGGAIFFKIAVQNIPRENDKAN